MTHRFCYECLNSTFTNSPQLYLPDFSIYSIFSQSKSFQDIYLGYECLNSTFTYSPQLYLPDFSIYSIFSQSKSFQDIYLGLLLIYY